MPASNWNFPPVRQGSPIGDVLGAGYHNAVRQALKWVDAERNKSGAGAARFLGDDSGVVLINNASGAAVDAFGILGIDTTVPVTPTNNLTDFQVNHVLQGVTPVAATHLGKFAIALEPIPNGAIGPAGALGVFACQVYCDSATVPDYADVNDGTSASLLAADVGLGRILWRDAGTGAKWAIVRLNGAFVNIAFYGKNWTEALPNSPQSVTAGSNIDLGSAYHYHTTQSSGPIWATAASNIAIYSSGIYGVTFRAKVWNTTALGTTGDDGAIHIDMNRSDDGSWYGEASSQGGTITVSGTAYLITGTVAYQETIWIPPTATFPVLLTFKNASTTTIKIDKIWTQCVKLPA